MARRASLLVASTLLATVESFPKIGAQSTRRIMLLHGSGSTAASFLNSPTRLGAKDFLAGVPMEGVWSSNELWNKPGMRKAVWNWHVSALDAAGPNGDWYASDTLRGLDDSIEAVEAAIVEQDVTGVVGLEQGGLVAALVAARAALGESDTGLRCAVVCGAAMPEDSPKHVELLHRLRDDTSGAALPTLHCLSKADTISPPASGKALAACFGPSAELLWHDRGNAMPSRMWWRDSDAFLERAWQDVWSGGRRPASDR